MLNQDRMPIVEALEKYIKENRISFHVPGHKGRYFDSLAEYNSDLGKLFSKLLSIDITEIEGMDDFHVPDGIILEARRLAAELYGAEETFFLVNGTTSGIMASIMASATEGDKIIVASNSHSSVMRGLVMSGAVPIYIDPNFDSDTMLYGGLDILDIEDVFKKYSDVKAIVLSNPSYYGTYSDLDGICRIAHRYGVVVIADEAHGAQLNFIKNDIPSGISCGCDIVVQSTHKMLGSLTQSSMLHVQGDLVDRYKLGMFVSMFTSTSPSYLLMASLDAVRFEMSKKGVSIWRSVSDMCEKAADEINSISGIRCIRTFKDINGKAFPIETSRLLISAAERGLDGRTLAHELLHEHNIDIEFFDSIYVLAVAGSGTKKDDIDILVTGLTEISKRKRSDLNYERTEISRFIEHAASLKRRSKMSPRNAIMSRCRFTELEYSVGMISADIVSLYPPDIPILNIGEEITPEIVDLISECIDKEIHMHGIHFEMRNDIKIYGIMAVEPEELRSIFGFMI